MPKRQSTAAKAARTAARQGAKYTAALHHEHAERERRRGRSRHPGGTWWIGSHTLLNLVNDSAIRALANSPAMGAAQGLAMKIAFPYGGPAGHGRDDSSPG